ncbi:UNVERIFIED_CONTAM: hypothetical protein HDU68_001126 [Siphonaria sp. JEL0065]|nr:hypothetical protein HDU68_001126 [Siphonaria sp. JEL0065]
MAYKPPAAGQPLSGLHQGNEVLSGNISRLVSEKTPITSIERYNALGLAVSNVEVSIAFYKRLGWELKSQSNLVTILLHSTGLELHIFKSDRAHEGNKNILMDYDDRKYPGINHMSFSVPNVGATKEFLESTGFKLSGTRQYPNDPRLYAIFIRDPDQTTIEFEKNGPEETVTNFHAGLIGHEKPIDHVGIRVNDPTEVAAWYAEKLGFNNLIAKFEYNPEKPLSNGRPWITQTKAGIDINLILNTNERPIEHVLITGGSVAPGILYTVWSIGEESVAEVGDKLKAEGVTVVLEKDIEASGLKFLAQRFVPSVEGRGSVFIQDPSLNILRLVGRA